jgi:hypothetical protein
MTGYIQPTITQRPAGTRHLIDDIEALRMPHGVDRWLVFARV